MTKEKAQGNPPANAPANGPANPSALPAGSEIIVKAARLNDDGEGVARAENGLTVFVPELLPEETAKVVITEVQKRFARARVVSRQGDLSPLREQPVCSVFGECGGCQLQHVTYSMQLVHKHRIVEHTLHRLAHLENVKVSETLGMTTPFRYRNQVQIALRYDDTHRRYEAGFFASSSHELVKTTQCHLEPLEMEDTAVRVLDLLNSTPHGSTLMAHHLILRESFTNGEQMVILALGRELETLPDHDVLVQRIASLPKVVSVGETIQPKPHGPVWGPTVKLLQGALHLHEQLGNLDFLISPRSFFQVNTAQAARLYEKVIEYAAVSIKDVVLDAYCGTGTISLLLAEKAHRVVGIESIRAAVEDARLNAEHNQIENVEFIVGEVERVVPKRLAKGEVYDVVVLDPPRKGCHPDVLAAVVEAKPRRVVYVSCNHATLARDLQALVDGGYDVIEAQPVDMFPLTGHVETCVLLVRRGAGA